MDPSQDPHSEIFRIDAQTGGLTPLRTQTVGQRPAAVLAIRYG